MLTNRDYKEAAGDTGIYRVCEMDTQYHLRETELIPANPTGDVYSVAKLFTVTAFGICVDRGLLSPDDRFLDVMGMELVQDADPKWGEVTLHMLLKHQWGIGTHGLLDIDAQDASLYPSRDYLSLVLKEPLPLVLGEERCYTDAAYYLLSRAIERVSGVTVFELLRRPLMEIMDFGEYAWSSCPWGHTMGATGLFLRCRDMVKIGVLYLNGGLWKGERILSRDWCRTVLERGYELTQREDGWYCKGGMHGQIIAIHPQKQLSVAWMGFSHGVDLRGILP